VLVWLLRGYRAVISPLYGQVCRYYAISAILIGWHNLLSQVLPADGGASWVLSIVGLTLVIRAALIPLFVKQIKSSRNMQLIQPKVKELQKKYGHDRERMAQETMKLYKDSGTNPFASCLPILLQMPIFFTLFSVLNNAAKEQPKGILSQEEASQFGNAELPGGIRVADTLLGADGHVGTILLALGLVLAMTATTFLTQRQLMSKNMPADALSGPYAQQQKMLLYVLPIVFAVGGIAFPIGVLFYWTTSNIWTMGQQFYVIRNNPAPGTDAERAKIERDRKKALAKGLNPDATTEMTATQAGSPAESDRRPAQRQQPQRTTRSQRKTPPKGVQVKGASGKGPAKSAQPKNAQPKNKAEAAQSKGAQNRNGSSQ
jgi:YidC/Oxa1 family membrane protein insertase